MHQSFDAPFKNEDGVSIPMIKAFEATEFFPTEYELEDASKGLRRTMIFFSKNLVSGIQHHA